jgi:nicotinamide phosphoribosyltransferase
MQNLILDSDSYKSSHFLQYPPGTEAMFNYFESRGGHYDRMVFFGLQYYLKKYLTQRITLDMVNEAAEFLKAHGVPFPYDGWKYLVERGGKIPIRIRAVPEGTVVPTHNVLFTVESTDPKVFWIVGWFETMLVRMWYPITVATQSYHIRKYIYDMLVKTADDPDNEVLFKLHDFGSRGVSSQESAEIGGASHLVNFMGSDTLAGVWAANKYYHSAMAAYSIPAAEHSTITSWGKEREVEAYRNMVKQFAKPGALVACVSDSYDLHNAVDNFWGKALHDEVVNSGATLVVRPDSGDPPRIVRWTLQRLDAHFGNTVNSKGYKVLNHVRVIQGDGINEDSLKDILLMATEAGYSATNVTFGMGGALLQQLNRDTQKFAMKCSEVTINGEHVPVFKDPVTDHGKKSKAGRLDLVRDGQGYKTIAVTKDTPPYQSELQTVFENGEVLVEWTLDEVRKRVRETECI